MVLIGVAGFAACSALCGATPTGPAGQAWIITFRVLQGVSAALLFPAALAIVVAAYPVHERGKALAIFFSVSRRSDVDRPDARRVSHRVDVAGDLLDQHPGRADRDRPDADREAGAGAHAVEDRRARRAARVQRHDPLRARPAAGRPMGLAERRDLGLPRRRPGAARRRSRRTRGAPRSRSCRCGCSPGAASPSTTSCCSCCRSASSRCSSSPASTRRSRWARARRRPACSCSSSSPASRSAHRSAAASSTPAVRGRRS